MPPSAFPPAPAPAKSTFRGDDSHIGGSSSSLGATEHPSVSHNHETSPYGSGGLHNSLGQLVHLSHIWGSSSSLDTIRPINHESPQLLPYPSSTTIQSNGSVYNASFMTSPSYDSLPEVSDGVAEVPDTLLPEVAQVPLNPVESEGSTSYQRVTSPVSPSSIPTNSPHTHFLPFTRDFLNDGYISYMFTPYMAKIFLVQLLLKVGNPASIQAVRDPNGSGAYFVFNNPSYYSPPPITIGGRDAWVLDYDVRSGGSVVPQELWVPHGLGATVGGRPRYVDQTHFHIPVFFVRIDGSLGAPVLNAAAGDIQLRDVVLPPPLQDRTTVKIRIAWPGHGTSVKQVYLRDHSPSKNPITFDRFVRYVGSRVQQFLLEHELLPVQQPFKWMVGHGNITPDEVMLIGIVHVSEDRWMPILQLARRVVV